MAVQPGELQIRLPHNPFHGLGQGVAADGEAEFLIGDTGAHRRMAVHVDIGADAQQHPLRLGGQRGQQRDLGQRIDDDPADTAIDRGLQFGERFTVAVQHDSLRIGPGGQCHSQFPGRAHIDGQALVGDPFGHRPGQQRLAGVDDLGVRKAPPVGLAAVAHLALVQDIGRSAVLIRDIGQRHAADGNAPVIVVVGLTRPDRRIEAGSMPPDRSDGKISSSVTVSPVCVPAIPYAGPISGLRRFG